MNESNPSPDDFAIWDVDHVWHPFTQMQLYASERAPVIASAEGFHLIDTQGRRYIDGHSSLWCNIHGHRVPEIDRAIVSQLGRVSHSTLLGLGNTPSIELARELVRVTPDGLNRVFYTDCGAAGVEAALKIAWQYHRQRGSSPEDRRMFACLGSAYHGDTVGAMSVGGVDQFRSLFGGLMFQTLTLPSPAQVPLDLALDEANRLLTVHQRDLAGVIVEPLVQAAAGILVHPPGYLSGLRAITRKLGLLLIADEIAVAFGRLGSLFACPLENVTPDILVLSKGLTGGYAPLAATLVTDEIYSAFLGRAEEGRTFYHGHTYTGHPLACAAAVASLRRIESQGVIANAQAIERYIAEHWVGEKSSWRNHRYVKKIRSRGTMVGIVTMADPQANKPFPVEKRFGHQLTLACRSKGLIVRNLGDTLVLMPAPAMPVSLVRSIGEIVTAVLDEYC